MRIIVKAKPAAKKASIVKIDDANFVVSVKEPPVEGRANRAVAKALAEYFDVSPSSVILVSGFSSKQKTFQILKNK